MLEQVWRRRWAFLSVLLGCLAVGGLYAGLAPRQYRVEARLLVQRQGLPNDPVRDSQPATELLATQAEVVRSTAVMQRVAQALGMTPSVERPWSGPVGALVRATRVTPVVGANVLVVNYDGPDEEMAVHTGRMIVAKYEEYLKDSEQGAQGQVLRLVAQKEAKLRGELDQLSAKYAALRKTSPLPGDSPASVSTQRQRLNQLADALTNAQLTRIDLESRVHSAAGSANPVAVASLGGRGRGVALRSSESSSLNTEFALIQDQLIKNQTQEQQLLRQFLPDHPDVIAVRRSNELLHKQLDDLNSRARRLLEDELVAAKAQEQQLQTLYHAEDERAKAIDAYQVRERQMLEEIARVQRLYDAVVGKVERARLADQSAGVGYLQVSVTVLKQPDVAVPTIFPPLPLLLALCTLLGIGGGLALVVLRERASPAPSAQLVPARVAEGNGDGAPSVVVTILDR
jgi:uncharacterized protein involved in exopolysaccharide biosynthesis